MSRSFSLLSELFKRLNCLIWPVYGTPLFLPPHGSPSPLLAWFLLGSPPRPSRIFFLDSPRAHDI
jgi:hypothetical protein